MSNKTQNIVNEQGYLVNGQLSLATLDDKDVQNGALIPVGNISSLTISPSVSKITKKRTHDASNSIINEVIQSTDVTISIDFDDLTDENLEKFTYADVTTVAGEAITDQPVKVFTGGIVPLGRIIDQDVAVVVEDDAGTIVYEENKNYLIQDSDIYVFSEAEQTALGAVNTITDGDTVHVSYTALEQKVYKAFAKNSITVKAYFSGVNTADSNKPISIVIPKLTLDPSDFNAISGEDFSTFTVSGTLLKSQSGEDLFTITR